MRNSSKKPLKPFPTPLVGIPLNLIAPGVVLITTLVFAGVITCGSPSRYIAKQDEFEHPAGISATMWCQLESAFQEMYAPVPPASTYNWLAAFEYHTPNREPFAVEPYPPIQGSADCAPLNLNHSD